MAKTQPEHGRTESLHSITGRAESGAGMDRKVASHRRPWRRIALFVLLPLVAVVAVWITRTVGGSRALRVDGAELTVQPVTSGVYEDFVPIRAEVEPRDIVYLDATEGGRVERILVEDGATVTDGQPLVALSNTTLQLDVIGREAAVTEQLNVLRTLELQLEQTRQQHRRELDQIEFDRTRAERRLERQQRLYDQGVLPRSDLEDATDDLHYQQDRKATELAARGRDETLQAAQVAEMKKASRQLESNLEVARRNLDDLTVRAPRSGRLSGFDLEVGQSVERGTRMGQIDSPDAFKLTADVDEFYLARVKTGLTATLALDGGPREVTVTKIEPQVTGGQFHIDLAFDGEMPAGIRRGQTIPAKLTLGGRSDAILIPNGAFMSETGGSWIFVVEGKSAVRRAIRTGRRNASQIEVVDGLAPGERVVTSSYATFRDADRLILD